MKIIKEVVKESIDSIRFDGRNFDDIESMIKKSKFKVDAIQQSNGKVEIDGKTIFKDDLISVEKDGVHIYKPSYVVH